MFWIIFVLELLFVVTLILDMLQTLDIKNHVTFSEVNVILGKHPSDRSVKIYFLAWIIGSSLVVGGLTYWLPQFGKYYCGVLVIAVMLEIVVILHNLKIGLKI